MSLSCQYHPLKRGNRDELGSSLHSHTYTVAIKARTICFYLASILQHSDAAQKWHPCCTLSIYKAWSENHGMQGLYLSEGELPKRGKLGEKPAEMWCVEQRYQQIQKTALNAYECTVTTAAEFSPRTGSPPTLTTNENAAGHIPAAQCNPLAGIWLSRLFAYAPLSSPLSLVCFSPLQSTTARVGI